jgi:hypothetical protein
MKVDLLIFAALILGMSSCGDDDQFNVDCLPQNLQNGVIAFYPFNDGSLLDESPNNNNFTNPTGATPSEDRNGNANCCFIFDNSQQEEAYLTTPNTVFLNGLDAFSISIWYQPLNNSIGGGTIQGMFSRGQTTRCPNRMGEWSLGLYDCRRAVFGHNNSVWASSLTNFEQGCQGEVDAQVGKWHHAVAVKKDDEYRIYFNGLLSEVAIGDADCGSGFQPAEDVGAAFIGYNFTGRIDDIIIYKRALEDDEVMALFELSACCE